jgi:ribonuclease P protein component
MKPRLTFTKAERLTGKTNVERLFAEGRSINEYPLRLLYRVTEQPGDIPVRLLIAVPKRKFKHAVDRNRIRRRIREAYRLNRHLMENDKINVPCFHLAFIFTSDKDIPYTEIEKRMKVCLERLQKIRLAAG